MKSQKLGDGYTVNSNNILKNKSVEVTAYITDQTKLDEVLELFESLAGQSTFDWQPTPDYPLTAYYVEQWNIEWQGVDASGVKLWQLSATFINR